MRDSAMTNVIVWPDTFTNRFHPEIGQAAVELLEDAGFKVRVPQEFMCCGRPLYDYGLLDTARKQLLQILETLREEIRAGIPLVVLEPSCAAVFRGELLNLFPRDEDARRLSRQTFVLSEFLEKKAPDVHLPKRVGRALVQIHCHHAAIIKKTDEKSILEKLGLECEFPDSGCCGMAGSFGFERGEKYDVSVKAGERSLLPRIREAGDDTIIIADGFSCREQIHQGTNRKAVHLAEVIHPVRFESTLPSFVPVLRTAAFIGTVGALAATVAAVYARRSS